MRLIIALMVALATTLMPIEQASARRAMPQPTATLYGQVNFKGKAARHILVEIMVGNCFSRAFKVLSTNASGFYRVDGLPANRLVHVAVNGFSKTARNKRYQATCGKGIMLRAGQLNRRNIALKRSKKTRRVRKNRKHQITSHQNTSHQNTPTPATGTIYGRVHHNGKAVRHILLHVMVGNCFSRVFKALSSNDAGFYRVDGLPVGQPIYVGINGFRAASAQKKLYESTCSHKSINLRAGNLTRYNIALKKN